MVCLLGDLPDHGLVAGGEGTRGTYLFLRVACWMSLFCCLLDQVGGLDPGEGCCCRLVLRIGAFVEYVLGWGARLARPSALLGLLGSQVNLLVSAPGLVASGFVRAYLC